MPDRSGDIKESSCDFNVLYTVQMDIETYNYADIIFHLYRAGKLTADDKKRQQEELKDNGLNAGVSFLPMD